MEIRVKETEAKAPETSMPVRIVDLDQIPMKTLVWFFVKVVIAMYPAMIVLYTINELTKGLFHKALLGF
jgi:hypothetical protein